jgi:hypothetical protein
MTRRVLIMPSELLVALCILHFQFSIHYIAQGTQRTQRRFLYGVIVWCHNKNPPLATIR